MEGDGEWARPAVEERCVDVCVCVSVCVCVCVWECVCICVQSAAPCHRLNLWILHIPAQSQAQVSPLVHLRWLTLFATIRHYYVIDLWPLTSDLLKQL